MRKMPTINRIAFFFNKMQ
uniref:Uncharacterized protein n=1 Tax=Anguilla anguilla TaxID=7936 RepID=A0A0E9S186_ANGAN